jgi:hypothetical protein
VVPGNRFFACPDIKVGIAGHNDLMGEIAERLTNVLARTAGNTVSPVATALLQAAAISTGHVDLAIWATPVGALAGSLTEEGVALVRQSWLDRSGRVQQFAEEVAAQARITADEVPLLADSNDLRRLLAATVEAATESRSDWRIRTLARVFLRGASDPAKVDEMIYLVPALRDIEGPEVRLLAQFAISAPEVEAGFKYRVVTPEDVIRSDPGLTKAFYPVLARLMRAGLVAEHATGYQSTGIGRFCISQLRELGRLSPTADS